MREMIMREMVMKEVIMREVITMIVLSLFCNFTHVLAFRAEFALIAKRNKPAIIATNNQTKVLCFTTV